VNDIFIGCDIEDISRFRNKIDKKSNKFLDKIFTKEEQAYCNSKSDPAMHYAGRFCAKEAVVKAVKSAEKNSSITINQIEIRPSKSGEPLVNFKIKIIGICKVSISHTLGHAISMALFVKG